MVIQYVKVSLSEYADETAVCCQYVCPNHNYLESWNDFEAINGHVGLQQPTIRPLYNTRQAQESFLVWSGQTEEVVKVKHIIILFDLTGKLEVFLSKTIICLLMTFGTGLFIMDIRTNKFTIIFNRNRYNSKF